MIGCRRGLRAVGVALAGVGVAFAVIAVLWVVEIPHDSVTSSDVEGTWVSSSKEAPGVLTLRLDGEAEAEGLTVYDHVADPVAVLGVDIDGFGEWRLYAGRVSVSIQDADDDEFLFQMFVMSSPLRGMFLRAIVGDPDAPRAVQDFRPAD